MPPITPEENYKSLVAWYRRCTPEARARTTEFFKPEDKNLLKSVEPGVKSVVKILNELGWKTFSSCEGHNFMAMAHVSFLVRKDQISAWKSSVHWPVYFDHAPLTGLTKTPYSEAINWFGGDAPWQFSAMAEAIFGDKDLVPVKLVWGDIPWTYLLSKDGEPFGVKFRSQGEPVLYLSDCLTPLRFRKSTLLEKVKRLLYWIIPRRASVYFAESVVKSVGKNRSQKP